MMDDKISVIIPAYNIALWLGRCLDSVLAQTLADLEVIVVNDGSNDDTAAIADSYAQKDSRVRVIHKENGGVTSARLRGLAEAKGEWIGFVDGDDYIEPDMYARLLENAMESGADISHCGYRMEFPGGRVDYYYNTNRKILQRGLQGCYDLLTGTFVEPGLWNKLYRRGLFAGLEGWMDPDIRINEDLLMNYYLFSRAEICVYEDFCPYHYLRHQGSASAAKLNTHKLSDPLKVASIILDEADAALRPAIVPRVVRQLITGATMPLGAQKELIAPYRKQTRKQLRRQLSRILVGKDCGVKIKMMALWAAVWPASYGWVHRAYARATGIDKKYDVE